MSKKRRLQKQFKNVIADEKLSDNLVNVLSAAQARRDVTNVSNNFFASDFVIPYTQLENIYLSNWVAKKIVEIPTEYIFKNGFTFSIPTNPEVEKKILDFYYYRHLEDILKKNLNDAFIYGGSLLLFKNPKADPMQPIDYSGFYQNEEIDFVARDISYCAVVPDTDITSENYFKPRTILLYGLNFEASNCLIFEGVRVPLRRIPNFRYIGMSLYQNVFECIINDQYITKGITNMVWRNNRWYYGIEGLNELVKNSAECVALSRLKLVEDSVSILGAGVIDKNDTVQFVSQAFAGLSEIDSRSIARLSAATNIPATILLGKSPDGQNATGESDLENFYNYIESLQRKNTHNMEKLFRVLIWMFAGKELEFKFEWNKPHNIALDKQVLVDTQVLANVEKMQQIGLPEEVQKDYLVKCGIVTTQQAEKLDIIKNDLLATEQEAVNELDNTGNLEAEDIENV